MINEFSTSANLKKLSSEIVFLIVPCFNEGRRWDAHYWKEICSIQDLRICFVNDGSVDNTSAKISPHLVDSKHELLELSENFGKAEAIRRGILHILMTESPLGVGYLDADGAFPIADVKNQISMFRKISDSESNPPAVWSSRVQLAGRAVERNIFRHYFARIIVTLLALRFKFKIYDTQSGMKIFPYTSALKECLRDSFNTRWFVDLEIFLRWRNVTGQDMNVWEEPLFGWKDIGESKLSGKQHFTVCKDIFMLNKY
jgi:glycosyltransferase involved in cell wall biosynthesis